MDKPRDKKVARNRKIRRIAYILLVVAAIPLITLGLARLKPAAPGVDGGTLWRGKVERGEMLRQVRGIGTLVPEEIRWIPAATQGRVERRLIEPGTVVKPETVIFELSNLELERDALDAETQLKAAEAELANQRVQLESQRLTQQAQSATVRADYNQARLQAEANEVLAKEQLISDLTLKVSKSRAEELKSRDEIERKRLEIAADSTRAQIAVYQARVDQLKALHELRRKQLDSLRVRAGMNGVLQQLAVEVGQQVTQGQNLARVADPARLKAQVRIAETQAKDIQVGQRAEVDTRNGVIEGRVIRIDPAAQQGTVAVDVALDGELPKGARPDLSVDGTVELERLENVLYVQRPASAPENGTISLFKLTPDGKEATRVQVKLGRSSVSTIEILEGLQVGDTVILSDTSAYDSYNRIRLN
jgi:HlyD family secretion protein